MSSSSGGAPAVSAQVRELAGALAELLAADRRLAVELNAAQRRLLDANDLLRVGVSPGSVRALLGPRGVDLKLAMGVAAGSPDALEAIADTIRGALGDYQSAGDQRCLVAADIGEAIVRLVDAMAACGFSETQARGADVVALGDGVYRQGGAE